MDIAITGIGILSAIGLNADETLKALKKGVSGIGLVCHLATTHSELPVGEVKLTNEEMKRQLGLNKELTMSRTTLMGAIAAHEAICSASAHSVVGRTILISGTSVGGMDVTEKIYQRVVGNISSANPADLLLLTDKHNCSSTTHDIAEILGLDCNTCTISTACSSALNSIILGCEMLKNHEADTVIAGGSEALSLFHLNGFNSLMILDHQQCRPFDKTRAGLNLGEGAAYVILRRSNDCLSSEIKAYITGYGNRCDAFHQTASSENGEGAFLAMTDALAMARLSPQEIDYVNAHGTGTPNNDASESAALRRVFANDMPPVSSTKSMTGHTTSASGAIETVICILAMLHGITPSSIGWKEKDENCIKPYVKDKNENEDENKKEYKTKNVMCNSFGFGGNNSSIVISRNAPHHTEKPDFNINYKIAADITIDSEEMLSEAREYIPSKEMRRMGRLMKAATLTSLKALRQAGIDTPDAIITATAYGMLETSEKILDELTINGEQTLSPTLFMQSTHNTIGSAIAIRTKCHGYNITYSHGSESLKWALLDAQRLIATGKARSVLVGLHDECTQTLHSLLQKQGRQLPPMLFSRAIVMCADNFHQI